MQTVKISSHHTDYPLDAEIEISDKSELSEIGEQIAKIFDDLSYQGYLVSDRRRDGTSCRVEFTFDCHDGDSAHLLNLFFTVYFQ